MQILLHFRFRLAFARLRDACDQPAFALLGAEDAGWSGKIRPSKSRICHCEW